MKRLVRFLAPFALGAAITAIAGWIFWGPGSESASGPAATAESGKAQVWTCSMHPQIRMDHKDICPLCGMDLTPIDSNQDPWEAEAPGTRLVLSDSARRMARVETMEVQTRELWRDLRTVGRVEFDETRVAYIAARINGRVDQVYADFPGTAVRQGEHLVKIYSPDLLSTQQEFLTALRSERAAGQVPGISLSAASRRRLELWGITPEQIDALAKSGHVQDHLTVYSPMGGTVIEKNIRAGQYVKEGDSLYTIADLTRVWLVLEVYESDLSLVRVGQPVQVTLESEPQRPMTGTVAFVEPVLTNASRTVRVRVIVENRDSRLKPGMYAQALVRVAILPGGQLAPTGLEGKYVCPMHPYEVSDRPGDCKECGMPLELVPGGPEIAGQAGATMTPVSAGAEAAESVQPPVQVLAVPADAVLTTGQRQLVYVEKEPGKYQLVEPKLGPRAGDYYPVLSGLEVGDRVVSRGNFLLDSQYQISGRASLLYPGGSTGDYAAPDPATGLTAKEQRNVDKLAADDRQLAMKQKICPITGANLGSMGVPVKIELEGRPVFLCCKGCVAEAKGDPAGTLKKLEPAAGDEAASTTESPFTAEELAALDELPPGERELATQQKVCPVTDFNLGSMGKPVKITIQGQTVFLCCIGCEEDAKADPEGTLKKVQRARAGGQAAPLPAASAPAAPVAPETQGGHHG
ncbi:MAG: efflux RND transporter periplasmic adaptor subunit [Thermoguttaceae bacterium]